MFTGKRHPRRPTSGALSPLRGEVSVPPWAGGKIISPILMARKLFAELNPLGVFWVETDAFSPRALCPEVHGCVGCDATSDAQAGPRLVLAAELSHVVAMQSLKISWGLAGKEVFAVCQGGVQIKECVAKQISPVVVQERAGSWRNCACIWKSHG